MGDMQKGETWCFYGEALMETLNLIYWYRVGLGVIAALICVAGWALTGLFDSIFQGASLAIIFYIITYYILKMKFIMKVEKTSKLLTQGIGAYFLTWVVTWVLVFSLTVPTAVFVYSPSHPTVGQTVTFDATSSYDIIGYITRYTWFFGDNQNQTGSNPTVTHTYATPGSYNVVLYVTDNNGLVSSPKVVVVEIGAS